MMTVKQVSDLTGVSVRTLQFYDEIGLFKPTETTEAGYRLYDEEALEILQQILFFKELDFTLKEIKAIIENPQFDKLAVFEKQRELIQIKRNRLNALLDLLDRVIKGEKSMTFHEFDMRDYYRVLEAFKKTHTDEIIKQLGSMEAFDEVLSELKKSEDDIVEMAVKQYGGLEAYTQEVKKNFQQFLSNGPSFSQEEALKLAEKSEAITARLLSDLEQDVASEAVQEIVGELVEFTSECNIDYIDLGEHYWDSLADLHLSNETFIEVTDKKYGKGAAEFFGQALKVYLKNNK